MNNNEEQITLNKKIKLSDVREVLFKYSFIKDETFYYYSRKNNI